MPGQSKRLPGTVPAIQFAATRFCSGMQRMPAPVFALFWQAGQESREPLRLGTWGYAAATATRVYAAESLGATRRFLCCQRSWGANAGDLAHHNSVIVVRSSSTICAIPWTMSGHPGTNSFTRSLRRSRCTSPPPFAREGRDRCLHLGQCRLQWLQQRRVVVDDQDRRSRLCDASQSVPSMP